MLTRIELNELESLVLTVGSDFDLTQGLGGNVSFKDDSRIWVKASGKRLSSHSDPDFYYQVRRTSKSFVDDIPHQVGKPSIEVFMHAYSTKRFVIHLHSAKAVALGMLAAKDASVRRASFETSLAIPYARPGVELMNEISSRVPRDYEGSVLLENHGVLHFADTVSGLKALISNFEKHAGFALSYPGPLPFNIRNLGDPISPEVRRAILWHATTNWRVSPDHCVFLGARASIRTMRSLEKAEFISDLIPRTELASEKLSVESEQLLWFLNIASVLPEERYTTIPLPEALSLSDWDAEKHRVSLAT